MAFIKIYNSLLMVYMLFFIDVGLGPVVENSSFCTHGRSSYFKLLCSIKFSTKSIQTKINKEIWYDKENQIITKRSISLRFLPLRKIYIVMLIRFLLIFFIKRNHDTIILQGVKTKIFSSVGQQFRFCV